MSMLGKNILTSESQGGVSSLMSKARGLHAAKMVTRMDVFNATVSGAYLPLTTPEVRRAAMLWAQVRNQGKTTAPPEALDGDALIAAQADLLDASVFGLSGVVVATANAGHLSALTNAVLWSDIEF
jgi:hypothetical protein